MARKAKRKSEDFFNSGGGYYAGPSVVTLEDDFKGFDGFIYPEGTILVGKLHIGESSVFLNQAIIYSDTNKTHAYEGIGAIQIPRTIDLSYEAGEKAVIEFMCEHGAKLTGLNFKPQKSKFYPILKDLKYEELVLITNGEHKFAYIGHAKDPRNDYKNGFTKLTLYDVLIMYDINPFNTKGNIKWKGDHFGNNGVTYFTQDLTVVNLNPSHRIYIGAWDISKELSSMSEDNGHFKLLEEKVNNMMKVNYI